MFPESKSQEGNRRRAAADQWRFRLATDGRPMVGSSPFSWFLGGGGSKKKSGENRGKHREGSQEEEEEELGVTEQLREFVRSFTIDTFKEFRLATTQQDDPSTSGDFRLKNHKDNSNVQKDLTGWQERHALLILSTVKEISELRYSLCPRHLKDKDFWRIYFLLVKNYVSPYEIRAIKKAKLKTMAQEAEKSVDDGAVKVEMMLTKKEECASDAC